MPEFKVVSKYKNKSQKSKNFLVFVSKHFHKKLKKSKGMKKTDANVFYYNSFQNKIASDRPGRPLTEETVSYFYILTI